MRILFVTSLYPNSNEPFKATFNVRIVESLLSAVQGTLIAPCRYLPFFQRQHPPMRSEGTCMLGCATVPEPRLKTLRPGVFLPPLIGRSLHWLFYFLAILRSASSAIRKDGADVIYALYAYPDGVSAVFIGLLMKKKVVVHAMGCDINLCTKYFLRRKIIVWALNRSAHVIAVSYAMKRDLIDLGIEADKISVIYNGVDQKVFYPIDRVVARERLGISKNEKNILFVGSLEKVKGVNTLLKAFHGLNKQKKIIFEKINLYIIGSGKLRSKIEFEINRLGINSFVHLLGNRTSDEVALWMNACDVFCLPSIREGLPNVIIEAIACNRPIVATRIGGIPELLSNYKRGSMVEAKNAKALQNALSIILNEKYSFEPLPLGFCPNWSTFSETVYAILRTVNLN